jgi:large subunit ribosomal protein L33
MAKAQKDTVFMVSSAGSGYFYANRRNKKKTKGESKLSLRKYDPIARKHVLFEEKKLSKLSKKFVFGQVIEEKVAPKKAEGKPKVKAEKQEKGEPQEKKEKKAKPAKTEAAPAA